MLSNHNVDATMLATIPSRLCQLKHHGCSACHLLFPCCHIESHVRRRSQCVRTLRASSTPFEFVSVENQWRVSSETEESLLTRSSNRAQFGSNSPLKRIVLRFWCEGSGIAVDAQRSAKPGQQTWTAQRS